MSWTQKHVVVTGGSGALGTAVCQRFLDAGATVHVPVFAPKELDSFALRNHARMNVRLGLDLAQEPAVARYYGELPALWASIHVAGGFAAGAIEDTSLEDLFELMNKNAVTCFLACREASKVMVRGGIGGRIVNVASKSALEGAADMAAYVASKAVVVSLTQSLAAELAPANVLVNAIAPTTIDTPANRRAMPNADFTQWSTPAQIAETIFFLASPQNGTTTGAVVPV